MLKERSYKTFRRSMAALMVAGLLVTGKEMFAQEGAAGGLTPEMKEQAAKLVAQGAKADLKSVKQLMARAGFPALFPEDEPARLGINLKTMEAKVFSWKEYLDVLRRIKLAVEAGNTPYYKGSRYMLGSLELVRIPAGTFLMGSNVSEEGRMVDENRHEVELTDDFWISVFEVTQEQWKAVMGKDDSSIVTKPMPNAREIPKLDRGPGLPMFCVTHEEAMQFCRKLTLLMRHQSASGAKGAKGTYVLPDDWEFTLPTEAQWEYVCRAGSQTPYSSGELLMARDSNYNVVTVKRQILVTKVSQGEVFSEGEENKNQTKVQTVETPYVPQLKSVGSCNANAFGVCDMHGNVWEWCRGAYYKYPDTKLTNPVGGRNGRFYVIRGGGWYSKDKDCRSARRYDISGDTRQNNIGFRVVLVRKKH